MVYYKSTAELRAINERRGNWLLASHPEDTAPLVHHPNSDFRAVRVKTSYVTSNVADELRNHFARASYD